MKVKEKATGKIYEARAQIVSIDLGKTYLLRYNIGFSNYQEFVSICCIYDNEEFNNKYEVIEG